MCARLLKSSVLIMSAVIVLSSRPLLANDDDHDDDHHHKGHHHKTTVFRESSTPSGYSYRYYSRPYFSQNYGYVGDDYTTPENAWWHDYEAQSPNRSYGQYYYNAPEEWNRDEYTTSSNIRLRGRIEDIRTYRSSEWDRPMVVAFLDVGNPDMRRVVLGPADEISPLDLRVGDDITVHGTPQTIEGIPAFVATRFTTRQVRWTSTPTYGSSYSAAVPAAQWYHGEVLSDDNKRVSGRTHKIAHVRLDDNTRVYVDLGPTDNLPSMDLDNGDEITILGHLGEVRGRTGLIADEFRWGGQSFVTNQGGQLRLDADVHAYR